MTYILDTHTLLWYLHDSPELSSKARDLINNSQLVFVSVASLWEIAIKRNIGKLELDESITQIAKLCQQKDINLLPIKPQHLDQLEALPRFHNDPFDRLIIAQARCEKLAIITRDNIVPRYDITTVW